MPEPLDLNELRKKAEAVGTSWAALDAYLLAATPDVLSALLDRIADQEKKLARYEAALRWYAGREDDSRWQAWNVLHGCHLEGTPAR